MADTARDALAEGVGPLNGLTYQHPVLGRRPIDLPEALRMLRRVTMGFSELIESLHEYDDAHPELWSTCSEHPEGNCGQRDLPGFFVTACIFTSDVRDAEALLASVREAFEAAADA